MGPPSTWGFVPDRCYETTLRKPNAGCRGGSACADAAPMPAVDHPCLSIVVVIEQRLLVVRRRRIVVFGRQALVPRLRRWARVARLLRRQLGDRHRRGLGLPLRRLLLLACELLAVAVALLVGRGVHLVDLGRKHLVTALGRGVVVVG